MVQMYFAFVPSFFSPAYQIFSRVRKKFFPVGKNSPSFLSTFLLFPFFYLFLSFLPFPLYSSVNIISPSYDIIFIYIIRCPPSPVSPYFPLNLFIFYVIKHIFGSSFSGYYFSFCIFLKIICAKSLRVKKIAVPLHPLSQWEGKIKEAFFDRIP